MAVAASCTAGGPARGPNVQVRDSAGVHLVTNTGPADRTASWCVNEAPATQVPSEGPDHQLNRVRAVLPLSDGTLAIANGGNREVLFASPTGTITTKRGRTGAGPGEFRTISALLADQTGSTAAVAVYDPALRRVTVLSSAGETPRVFPVLADSGAFEPLGRLADRRWVGTVSQGYGVDSRRGVHHDSVIVLVADSLLAGSVGRVHAFGAKPTVVFTMALNGQQGVADGPVPFAEGVQLALGADQVVAADPNRGTIELYDPNGRLRTRVDLGLERVKVTSADLARLKDRQLAAARPSSRPLVETRFQATAGAAPATFPHFDRLLVGQDGSLWLRRFVEPPLDRERFLVVTGDGTVLGRVDLPTGFALMAVTRTSVIGVTTLPSGAETVTTYDLRRDGDCPSS